MLWTELVSLILIVTRAVSGQFQCIPTDPCLANILSRLETLESLIKMQPSLIKAPTSMSVQ
ncbi:hypothetical protein CHS0354_026742, partial [Potamilus streckersoni]